METTGLVLLLFLGVTALRPTAGGFASHSFIGGGFGGVGSSSRHEVKQESSHHHEVSHHVSSHSSSSSSSSEEDFGGHAFSGAVGVDSLDTGLGEGGLGLGEGGLGLGGGGLGLGLSSGGFGSATKSVSSKQSSSRRRSVSSSSVSSSSHSAEGSAGLTSAHLHGGLAHHSPSFEVTPHHSKNPPTLPGTTSNLWPNSFSSQGHGTSGFLNSHQSNQNTRLSQHSSSNFGSINSHFNSHLDSPFSLTSNKLTNTNISPLSSNNPWPTSSGPANPFNHQSSNLWPQSLSISNQPSWTQKGPAFEHHPQFSAKPSNPFLSQSISNEQPLRPFSDIFSQTHSTTTQRPSDFQSQPVKANLPSIGSSFWRNTLPNNQGFPTLATPASSMDTKPFNIVPAPTPLNVANIPKVGLPSLDLTSEISSNNSLSNKTSTITSQKDKTQSEQTKDWFQSFLNSLPIPSPQNSTIPNSSRPETNANNSGSSNNVATPTGPASWFESFFNGITPDKNFSSPSAVITYPQKLPSLIPTSSLSDKIPQPSLTELPLKSPGFIIPPESPLLPVIPAKQNYTDTIGTLKPNLPFNVTDFVLPNEININNFSKPLNSSSLLPIGSLPHIPPMIFSKPINDLAINEKQTTSNFTNLTTPLQTILNSILSHSLVTPQNLLIQPEKSVPFLNATQNSFSSAVPSALNLSLLIPPPVKPEITVSSDATSKPILSSAGTLLPDSILPNAINPPSHFLPSLPILSPKENATSPFEPPKLITNILPIKPSLEIANAPTTNFGIPAPPTLPPSIVEPISFPVIEESSTNLPKINISSSLTQPIIISSPIPTETIIVPSLPQPTKPDIIAPNKPELTDANITTTIPSPLSNKTETITPNVANIPHPEVGPSKPNISIKENIVSPTVISSLPSNEVKLNLTTKPTEIKLPNTLSATNNVSVDISAPMIPQSASLKHSVVVGSNLSVSTTSTATSAISITNTTENSLVSKEVIVNNNSSINTNGSIIPVKPNGDKPIDGKPPTPDEEDDDDDDDDENDSSEETDQPTKPSNTSNSVKDLPKKTTECTPCQTAVVPQAGVLVPSIHSLSFPWWLPIGSSSLRVVPVIRVAGSSNILSATGSNFLRNIQGISSGSIFSSLPIVNIQGGKKLKKQSSSRKNKTSSGKSAMATVSQSSGCAQNKATKTICVQVPTASTSPFLSALLSSLPGFGNFGNTLQFINPQ